MRIERADHHARDPQGVIEDGPSRRLDHGPEPDGPNLGQAVAEFFKFADADGDGRVSQPELEAALQKVLNPPVSYTQTGDLQNEPHRGSFSATA